MSLMPRPLSPTFAVSAQITAQDVAILKDMGFKTIVNNRPDGEAADQPASAEIQLTAQKHGLAYVYIPVSGYVSEDNLAAMSQALTTLPSPILAYCKSGSRSAHLWQAVQPPARSA